MSRVIGAAGRTRCHVRDWDSEFFGVRIGEVDAARLSADDGAEMDEWAVAQRIECLYLFADAGDEASHAEAVARGFQLIDTRVNYLCPTAASADVLAKATLPPRVATAADIPALKAIAGVSHQSSRFYRDTRFPRERCAALYERWIERSVEGWVDRVLVTGAEGDPDGYVSSRRNGVLGLLAVRDDRRQRGSGLAMLSAMGVWLASEGTPVISALTQQDNLTTRRLLERIGGEVDATSVVYHRWSCSAD